MPNAVPIFYKKILDDSRLLLVDNLMKKTLANINANHLVSVSVWNEKTGFQFKGSAVQETSGDNYEAGSSLVKDGTPKGVIVVNIEEIYLTSPGPEAGSRVDRNVP
jgi:predicted pyridoxine 5'-phosphate oxidase superfamily flavin-nucleotide-binding protein